VTTPEAAEIRLYRLPQTLAVTSFSKSMLYDRIGRGVFTRPVKLGPMSVAWPSDEVAVLVRAVVAGASDAQLEALVKRLHKKRTENSVSCQPATAVA
jgi:predicted DNA-binding transcriptional regulator AlpA